MATATQIETSLATLTVQRREAEGLLAEAALVVEERPKDKAAQAELEALEEELAGYGQREIRLNAALLAARHRESKEGRAAEAQARQDSAKETRRLMGAYAKEAGRLDEIAQQLADTLGRMKFLGEQIASSSWDAGLRRDREIHVRTTFGLLRGVGAALAARLIESGTANLLLPHIEAAGRTDAPPLAETAAHNRANLERSLDHALGQQEG